MSNQKKLVIIAGAGLGLGDALLKRFNSEEYQAVGLTRTRRASDTGDIRVVDLTDALMLEKVIAEITTIYGVPKIVIHNPAKLVISSFEETSIEDFEAAWRTMVLSAALLAKRLLPEMAEKGQGAFIVSGATASLRGGINFSAFASAKFALRGLVQSLAREYGAKGIHVAHTILDGIIDTPASRDLHSIDPARMMKTEEIAALYWQLAHQHKSTWTHELDLRPMTEAF